jgi:hypothetical protein
VRSAPPLHIVQTHSDGTRSPASPQNRNIRQSSRSPTAIELQRPPPSRAPASRDGGQSGWEISAAWLGVLAVGVPLFRLTRRWGGQTAAAAEVNVSSPTGVRRRRRRRQALSVQVMIASRRCARVFPALPVKHCFLQQGVEGFHRGVVAAGADLPVEPIRPLFFEVRTKALERNWLSPSRVRHGARRLAGGVVALPNADTASEAFILESMEPSTFCPRRRP